MRSKKELKDLPCNGRNAFTLIEVMVASILISLVGLSLLQMHQNSADMSYKMQEKFENSDWALMSAFELKLEEVKKNSRFETVMKPFRIDEREIRAGLNQKLSLSASLVERIDLSDITGELEGEFGESIPSIEGFRLEVYKQDLQMEHETYSVYRLVKP
jgi:prepilin-type N-terminal cleavage/methylation domain-containing protein